MPANAENEIQSRPEIATELLFSADNGLTDRGR